MVVETEIQGLLVLSAALYIPAQLVGDRLSVGQPVRHMRESLLVLWTNTEHDHTMKVSDAERRD
jgi:hypothetical protein